MRAKIISLLISFVLVFCYYQLANLVVPHSAFANLSVGSQWQDNVSHALAYSHIETPAKVVVVGSSLTARLPLGMESEGLIHNLAFGGDGPITGLKIILNSTHVPEVVGIEINLIDMAPNEKLLDRVTGWRGRFVDVYLPFTMEWYSPPRLFLYWKKFRQYNERKVTDDRPPPKLFNQLVEEQRSGLSHSYSSLAMERIKIVTASAEVIMKRGSHVFFYFCPIDSKLNDAPKVIDQKKLMQSLATQFEIMEMPSSNEFTTTDGLHLTEASAKVYAKNMINFLNLKNSR
jgi:hypothetical protein